MNITKPKTLYTTNKHPLIIGKKILQHLNHPIINAHHQSSKHKQPFTALPFTNINIPKSISTAQKILDSNPKYNTNWSIYYADASATNNPGPGCGAWACSQNPTTDTFTTKVIKFQIPYEINFYELHTIHQILFFLINHPAQITKKIIIHSDSDNTINWINGSQQPSSYTLQREINHIHFKIHFLEDIYNVQEIVLQKVKSHTNVFNHNEVDQLARSAAKAIIPQNNLQHYYPYYIQLNILKQLINLQQNQLWRKYRTEYLNKKIKNDRPIVKAIQNNTYKLKKLLNLINNHTDRGIITQLMCGETPTNNYFMKYSFYKVEHNNGFCKYCSEKNQFHIETAHHIIFKCPQYKHIRTELKQTLGKINQKLIYSSNWGHLTNLLFPWTNHFIIPKKSKDTISLQIWKQLIQFCKRTQNRAFDPTQLFNLN